MAEHQLSRIWDDALSLYTETTGINLHDTRFPKPQSAEDLLNQLDRQQSTFADFRKKKAKIFNALSCFLTPVERLGKVASDGASTVFAPSLLIFGAVIYLINVCTTLLRQPRARRDSYGTADAVDRCKAAHGVSAAYDAIISLFETMDESISRLSVHLQHEISPQLRRIVTEILVTLMSICARSTKYIKEGRALKYLKGLLGRGSAVQGALDRLKTLTENEAKMVVALTLSQASKTGKTVDDLAAWMDALRSVSGDKDTSLAQGTGS
ncbi:MAG: hypothetical protein M1826_006356 [Phylliscum demangeonii]|nr:MAG: hypothetical protein M1826_006356 [Phylliscum demangeonii]